MIERDDLFPLDFKSTSRTIEVAGEATADGSGAYSIEGIAAGEYTLVIQSNNRSGKDIGTFDNAITDVRDLRGRVHSEAVSVQPGKTVEGSHEFGLQPDD